MGLTLIIQGNAVAKKRPNEGGSLVTEEILLSQVFLTILTKGIESKKSSTALAKEKR
ncbi:hypothetical protein PY092_01300 [Muricauda sp. 334s03]|uniref:Uncharacterized protein n=1 Tax=Flagellimonas yonaguniensis TaxID=3031325 RepID=A0ABT5XUB5_9FLAO|nr:hypothetical protein [[Muricauda] yonaguniensis]MDF0714770.1 hypothetical protein [[Muricauda] yonaguniensis]